MFLRSYRYFMKPDDLLEKLIYRYCAVPPYDAVSLLAYKQSQASTQLRTVVFLKYWITTWFD